MRGRSSQAVDLSTMLNWIVSPARLEQNSTQLSALPFISSHCSETGERRGSLQKVLSRAKGPSGWVWPEDIREEKEEG